MIDLSRTIPGLVVQRAAEWADRTAVQDHGIALNFSELEQNARQVAQGFIARGFKAGERFAIWAPNIHEWIWVAIGGMMAGGVLVPLNTRYKGIEAGEILEKSGARLLFTVSNFLDVDYASLLQGKQPKSLDEIVLLRGDNGNNPTLNDFLQVGNKIDSERVDVCIDRLSGESISDIMYTSGTTGSPKGVMSTHGQVVAVFEAWSEAVGLSSHDRYLIINPFFHSFGYKAGWLACLLTGATALPESVFVPAKIFATIDKERISMLPGAPMIFQSLLADPQLAQTNLNSLRCAVTGAATVPEQLVRDMHNVLGFKQVYTGYGLTECGVVSICCDNDDFETIANTSGRALEGTEVKVVDEQDQVVAAGDIGYIKAKGFNVMSGYFNDPDATAQVLSKDGWLDTGDIGWINEKGYIKVTDRAKDMFICGGFNCYPAEIENLLLGNEQIADVAVIGVGDDRMGEVGHAFIVAHQPDRINIQALGLWCRDYMANYKIPKSFTLVSELPRNASGKIQKFLLKADA